MDGVEFWPLRAVCGVRYFCEVGLSERNVCF